MKSEDDLKRIKKIFDEDLARQTKEGLAKVYAKVGCGGVAKEIKAGRNVTKNAEYGIRMCVHGKTSPRVNPDTLQFYPQTKRAKELEEKFVDTVNKALEGGGFKKMSPSLLSDMRKKDKNFERMIKKRREKR